jgi:hypothetical protein
MWMYLQRAAVILAAVLIGVGVTWFFRPAPPARVAAPVSSEPAPGASVPVHPALPRMQVIAQYGGPLTDTLIQRLRDPLDGTTCYLYLPIAVHHAPPNPETGYVEYGANTVGSISCFPAQPMRAPTARAAAAP